MNIRDWWSRLFIFYFIYLFVLFLATVNQWKYPTMIVICVCVWEREVLHGWRPQKDSGVAATCLTTTDTAWWICQGSGNEKNRQGRVVSERADKKKWERLKCDFTFVCVCMPGNGDCFMPNGWSSVGGAGVCI